MHIFILYMNSCDIYVMQAQFAGVLRDLCISDEIALEIHQARIVSTAIVSIAVVSASPTRSPSRSTRRDLYYTSLPPYGNTCLGSGPTATAFITRGCSLYYLRLQAGGVESIIDAARRHFDSVEVQAAVAGALRNLSELDEVAADTLTYLLTH